MHVFYQNKHDGKGIWCIWKRRSFRSVATALLIRKVACICTCELDRPLLLLTACFWTGPDTGKCSTQLSVVKVVCTDRAGNAIDGGIGKAFCVQGNIYQTRDVLLHSDTTQFRGIVSIWQKHIWLVWFRTTGTVGAQCRWGDFASKVAFIQAKTITPRGLTWCGAVDTSQPLLVIALLPPNQNNEL